MHGYQGFYGKEDAAEFVSKNGIRIINLCHIPEDGRLKTLSFSAADKERVLDILEFGERVDGSSLFSFVEPGRSDIYISPDLEKAFVNPFATIPTLNVLCHYLDETGEPLSISPRNVLARAEEKLRVSSGIILRGLAELEFYVISKLANDVSSQKAQDGNYHESAPFASFENVRSEILATLADIGIATKYAHCEVGRILAKDNTLMEQHEVELKAQGLVEMAEAIAVAKWVIRNACARHGLSVSFSPKIALDHAGTGMHIHLCCLRNNENIIADSNGNISNEALRMIGGILDLAPSLAAFGNTTPVSYLRFIARKESPMHICWSARDRLALIRIPLWWSFKKEVDKVGGYRKTFEYRAPDPLANPYLLFSGVTVAVNRGLENPEKALKIAENLHVEADGSRRRRLKRLPRSCHEAARNLRRDQRFYEEGDVFPRKLISKTIEKLRAYKDKDLWKGLSGKKGEVESLLKEYLYSG